MSAYIRYHNFVFEDPQPYVSLTEEDVDQGGSWTIARKIKLEGQITGTTQDEIYKKRYNIINGLKTSYQEFVVIENTSGDAFLATNFVDPHGGAPEHFFPGEATDVVAQPPAGGWADFGQVSGADLVVSGGFTKIEDISFDSFNYPKEDAGGKYGGGVLGYSISMSCYNTGDFLETYYVLDPVDQIEYTESEENIIEIKHKVSARGVNTNDIATNALVNAKGWVKDRTGNANFGLCSPVLMSDANSGNAVLISQNESIDRLGGIYSVDESWKYNPSADITKTTFQKYSFAFSSGASDDYLSVDVSLDVQGGLNADLATLRNEIPDIDALKNIAETEVGFSNLSYFPNSYKINENENAKQVKIAATFDSNTGDYDPDPLGIGHKPYFDYEISIDRDATTNVSKVGIQGELKLRKNQLYTWQKFQAYFDAEITEQYLYELATGHYKDIMNAPFSLNPLAESYSFTEKSGDPSISINVAFSDKDWITGFKDAGYSISETPSIRQHKPKASCVHNGEWVVPFLGYYNRETISFSLDLEVVGDASPNTPIDLSTAPPHNRAQEIKHVVTGEGFDHAAFNPADAFGIHVIPQANLFHDKGPIGDRLTAAQKYGVRIKGEKFNIQSGVGSNNISYKYEYTKPANTSISVKIP